MSGEEAGRDPPLLDWRDSSHWSRTPKPCRYCQGLTNLRDSKRSPAHKSCAETALAQQAADLYAQGCSIQSVARQLGRSYGGTRVLLLEAGVTLRGRGGSRPKRAA